MLVNINNVDCIDSTTLWQIKYNQNLVPKGKHHPSSAIMYSLTTPTIVAAAAGILSSAWASGKW